MFRVGTKNSDSVNQSKQFISLPCSSSIGLRMLTTIHHFRVEMETFQIMQLTIVVKGKYISYTKYQNWSEEHLRITERQTELFKEKHSVPQSFSLKLSEFKINISSPVILKAFLSWSIDLVIYLVEQLGSSSSDWEESNGEGEIFASEFMQSGVRISLPRSVWV